MKPPVITTVIPTYRRAGLLKRAIRSALNQTRSDLIVSVYDNASGDETQAVVDEAAKIDPRVRYFCQPENIGIARNFDYGMRHVETPYFSFLSDDDIILPGFYEEAIGALEWQPSAMLFAAVTIMTNFDGTLAGLTLDTWQPGIYHSPAGLYTMLRVGCPFWTGVVFRRAVASDVGFLDCDTGAAADTDFLLRVAARHSFVVSKRPGAIFFVNPDSVNQRRELSQLWNESARTIHNIKSSDTLPHESRTEALRLFQQRLQRRVFSHALNAAMRGDQREALEAAGLLESNFPTQAGAAQIKGLVTLDRLGLRPLVRFVAAATRVMRKQGFLFALMDKRKYQRIITEALQELDVEPSRHRGARELTPRPIGQA
jgi:glycosyltransferase involved in cell wall biosynthesis